MSKLPPPPKRTQAAPPKPSGTPAFGKVKSSRYRVVLNCTEGWGKTTCMSHAPNVGMIMCGRETGLETLRGQGRVPDVDAVHVESWPELLALLRSDAVKSYDTLCIDTATSAYDLLSKHVLDSQFSGNSEKFKAFGKGVAVCEIEWNQLLDALERTGKNIIIGSHVTTSKYSNPEGENYNRYTANLPDGVWALLRHWADAVLFGTFLTHVEQGKASGGTERVIYTEHRAAHDAKNRYGMDEFISVPRDTSKIYETLFNPITKGK